MSNVVAIAAGNAHSRAHSLALKSDGTVIVWGSNLNGATNVPAGLSGVLAIAAADHVLAVKSDHTVVGWGVNNTGQINVPAGLSNVIAVGAGRAHSLALKTDGTVVVWGGWELSMAQS